MYRLGEYREALCRLTEVGGSATVDLHLCRGAARDALLLRDGRDGAVVCVVELRAGGKLAAVLWNDEVGRQETHPIARRALRP